MENKKKLKKDVIRKIYNKYSGTITISIMMIFTVLVVISIRGIGGTTIATESKEFVTNSAEGYFYNKEYDKAIEEYKNLQGKNAWPIYNVKIAEVYSVQGLYEESNRILEDSVIKRYNLFDEKGADKYSDVDNEFCNLVVFTLYMNGEYDKALEYGQVFLKENTKNYQLERTMFAIYLAQGDKESAQKIIDTYDIDVDSAYELASYAKMKLTMDDWQGGLETLRKAWDISKDEVKIYDVIEEMAEYDESKLIGELNKLIKDDSEEVSYKLWLAKYNSLSKNNSQKALDILKEVKSEDAGDVMINYIKAEAYRNLGDKNKAQEYSEKAIKNAGDSYTGKTIESENYYNSGDYDKALELCKEVIIEKNKYSEAYGDLMAEIVEAINNNGSAEPYYRTALYYEPCNYNIMLNASEYYLTNSLNKNQDISDAYFKLATLIKPKNTEFLYKKATLEMNNDNEKKAIELMEKCTSINDNVLKYHRLLGTLYFNKEEYDKAIAEYRKAYSIDENDIENLNNAACYYLLVKKDINRGYFNMEAAYKAINDDTDMDVKSIITENYNKAKDIKKLYDNRNGNVGNIPEFKLFN